MHYSCLYIYYTKTEHGKTKEKGNFFSSFRMNFPYRSGLNVGEMNEGGLFDNNIHITSADNINFMGFTSIKFPFEDI
jgi:hypothetical protein